MRGVTGLLAGIALLAACNEPATTAAPPTTDQLAASAIRSALEQQLNGVQAATASFHNIEAAARAGWSAQITGCMTSDSGGMGFHYGNPDIIDGTVSVDQPELLLYEPKAHGVMQLVAVEYIIPYTAHPRDADPPVLLGQQFTRNDVFQLWGLHAWIWKQNPRGIFANWNPRVNCEHAPATMTMSMSH